MQSKGNTKCLIQVTTKNFERWGGGLISYLGSLYDYYDKQKSLHDDLENREGVERKKHTCNAVEDWERQDLKRNLLCVTVDEDSFDSFDSFEREREREDDWWTRWYAKAYDEEYYLYETLITC